MLNIYLNFINLIRYNNFHEYSIFNTESWASLEIPPLHDVDNVITLREGHHIFSKCRIETMKITTHELLDMTHYMNMRK